MNIKILKCGCAGMSTHSQAHDGLPENHPSCIVHDTCIVKETPNLEGRKARCAYYGMPVKTGNYNGNACGICKVGGNCECEKDSSLSLWFFVSKPEKEYDEYYCACHGDD